MEHERGAFKVNPKITALQLRKQPNGLGWVRRHLYLRLQCSNSPAGNLDNLATLLTK
jgi:hypothetical protein